MKTPLVSLIDIFLSSSFISNSAFNCHKSNKEAYLPLFEGYMLPYCINDYCNEYGPFTKTVNEPVEPD